MLSHTSEIEGHLQRLKGRDRFTASTGLAEGLAGNYPELVAAGNDGQRAGPL